MASAKDFLVLLDDGHGPHTAGKRTPYIKALGRSIRENEFNKAVVDLLEAELKRIGFRTLQLAPTDLDTPLITRTNTANRANGDILVSIHFNAMGNTFAYSSAKGFSVHIQEGSSNNSKAYKLAALMVKELAKGTPQTNRGIVKQNLHMTRASKMPAVLVEAGFMDDPKEAMLMIDRNFHREVVTELAAAICSYFGVSYKGAPVQASKPVTSRDYLLNGDTGSQVRAMQADLKKAGYSLAVDGIFGDGTEKAVKSFQLKNGLKDDGVFGKASRSKLASVLANKDKKPVVKPAEKPKPKPDITKEEVETIVKKVHETLVKELAEAKEAGITDGSKPTDYATRAETAVMVLRGVNLAVDKAVEKVLSERSK